MQNTNNSLPGVAVVIPTYNRWEHVSLAIDSCLEQSHPHVEIIVVDDASTDGTPENIKAQYGDRVRLIELPENIEKSRARNRGIEAAESEYVCMLDSDDTLHHDGIENRLRVFLEEPAFDGVSYGSTHYIGQKNDVDHETYQSGDVLQAYLDNFDMLNNNAFLLRRSTMLNQGMYRNSLTNMEDRELLIRLTAVLPFRYCGSVVQSVRRVENSARSCYCRLLRQGNALTEGLKKDPVIMKKLGARFRVVEFMENSERARAMYKLKMFGDYVVEAKELYRRFPDEMKGNVRFRRRIFFASLLKHIVRPVRPMLQHNLRSA